MFWKYEAVVFHHLSNMKTKVGYLTANFLDLAVDTTEQQQMRAMQSVASCTLQNFCKWPLPLNSKINIVHPIVMFKIHAKSDQH